MDKFEDWAAAVEIDLQGIAGNLEYVSSVLEKEQGETAAGSTSATAASAAVSSS